MAFQQGDVYNFNLGNAATGVKSTVVAGAPAGFTFPGDSGFPGKSGINSQYGHFDPRVGIAWDPFGDGKTAIRAGAGMAHDFIEQDLHLNTSSSLPFRLTTITAPGVAYSLSNPWPSGDPFPYTFNPKNAVWPTPSQFPCLASTCPPGFLPIPSNMHTHVEYSWNLGVQRQVNSNWFVSATYAGNHILHVWSAVELNPATFVAGQCAAGQYGANSPRATAHNQRPRILAARRVLNLANPNAPPLGNLTQYDDGGTQFYHGLLFSTNYRLRSGLAVSGNYTWSHCTIGLAGAAGRVLNPGANYLHSGYGSTIPGANNRNADSGNCVQDRRQIANLTVVYNTPKFSNKAARILAGGWSMGTAVQARTGAYLALVSGVVPDPSTGSGGNAPGTQRMNPGAAERLLSQNQGASCGAPGAFCEQWLNAVRLCPPPLRAPSATWGHTRWLGRRSGSGICR